MRLFPLICLICLTSCAQPKVNYIIIKRPPVVIKQRCQLPPKPSPISKPLPDSNRLLIDVLTDKLVEWNRYGSKVEHFC